MVLGCKRGIQELCVCRLRGEREVNEQIGHDSDYTNSESILV